MRAGASIEQIVSETGWPADKVARYAEPPLRERAYIVELAQRAQVRGSGGTQVLGELVADTWRSAVWDAYRSSDGRWRVTASWDRERATWIYEPAGRSVSAVDDDAARIIGREPAARRPEPTRENFEPIHEPPRQTHEAPVEPAEVERPRLVSVPDPTPEAPSTLPEPDVPEPARSPEPARQTKKSRRGRARVPSWDEILFGATRTDD